MKAELTGSGFATVAGLRAGRSERFICDESNFASLTLANDTLCVTRAHRGEFSVDLFPVAQINLARKAWCAAVKVLRKRRVPILL